MSTNLNIYVHESVHKHGEKKNRQHGHENIDSIDMKICMARNIDRDKDMNTDAVTDTNIDRNIYRTAAGTSTATGTTTSTM